MAEHTDTDFETAVPPFVPPHALDRDRRRRRRRRAALALLLLAVGGSGWWWHRIGQADDLRVRKAATERARVDAAHCPGLDQLSTGDYALSRPGGSFGEQCLGWTVTADYPFDSTVPEVESLISTIVTANQKVRDGGRPYVRIAVMMSMTWQTGGALSEREIISALRGAAVAQHAANVADTRLRDGVRRSSSSSPTSAPTRPAGTASRIRPPTGCRLPASWLNSVPWRRTRSIRWWP